MCLILFSYCRHPENRLIIAANRDEVYNRPTRSLSFWDENASILAGQDLQCSGTWLGITRNGRIAAITNYREPGMKKQDAPSRGLLVRDYLSGGRSPKEFAENAGHRVMAGQPQGRSPVPHPGEGKGPADGDLPVLLVKIPDDAEAQRPRGEGPPQEGIGQAGRGW